MVISYESLDWGFWISDLGFKESCRFYKSRNFGIRNPNPATRNPDFIGSIYSIRILKSEIERPVTRLPNEF